MRHSQKLNTRPNLASLLRRHRLVLLVGGLLSAAVLSSGCSPLKALRGDPFAYQVQLLPGSSREKSLVRCRELDCPSPTYHATTWTPLQPPNYVASVCTSCVETGAVAETEPATETDSEPPSPELAPEEVPVPPPMSPEDGLAAPPEEPGLEEPGFDEPGLGEPGAVEPGVGIPGLGEPPISVPGPSEPGFGEPGLSEPGFGEPGPVQPGLSEPDDEDQPRKLEPPEVIDLPFPDAGASREVPPRRLSAAGTSDRDGNAGGAPALIAPEIDLVGASLAEGAEPWSARIVSGD